MECNKDEVARAKAVAERKMLEKDFVSAKKVIIKAQQLSKEVDDIDIPKIITICDVHCAAGAKVNAEIDWYGILQVPVTANDALIKKQYHKLALLLHPDKNKFGGAEAAFKLVGEASMTLTDSSKRSAYDMKRNTFRGDAERPRYQQRRRHEPARSRATPVNHHDHQAANPAGTQTTFWTMCPYCNMRYKHYISVLKKSLRCHNHNCYKVFIAHEFKEQAVRSRSNQQYAPQQIFPSPQTSFTGQKAWSATTGVHVNTGSHHAGVNTKRQTDGNTAELNDKIKSGRATGNASKVSSTGELKRRRRAVIESSESSISETSSDSEDEILEHGLAANSAGPGQQMRRSSRQKQEIKYNEESDDDHVEDANNNADDDFANSPSLKRSRRSGMFHGDNNHQTTKLNEDIASHNGPTNGVQRNGETMHGRENSDGKEKEVHSVSSNGLSPIGGSSDHYKFTYADPQFFDFGRLRDENEFRAGQIWAVYDDQGCMPRSYARITEVETTPEFMLHFVWLEFDPRNKAEKVWSHGGLPVACGRFKHGESETTNETGMFSGTISFKSKTRNSYEIYPRENEVWALFKEWDIDWSSDADKHKYKSHRYDVVQVLSDLTTTTGIVVMPLMKIKGYFSLFMQSREAAPYMIHQHDTLRFSHRVPHHVMSETEKESIPEGSLELDPAALPLDLEEAFPSVILECSLVRSQGHDAKCAGLSSGNSGKGFMNVGEGKHTTFMNAGAAAKSPKEENSKHNSHTAGVTDVDGDTIGQTEILCAFSSKFYDFSQKRLLQKFSHEQIWAIYSAVDNFPNYYGFIEKVDLKNDKVQVRWLDVCPQGEEEIRLLQEGRPIGCGTFRLSNTHDYELLTYTGTDAFSHRVEARPNGKEGEYEIIPLPGEIWAVYKNWRAGWTAQDFEKCEYELVEVLCHTDSSIQVRVLKKVDGHRTLFMPYIEGSLKIIRKDEYPKFSHQIPCFDLTHDEGGNHGGYLELDPFALPEEALSVR
ncbi:unnamed protein product [Urochloa humidicola]